MPGRAGNGSLKGLLAAVLCAAGPGLLPGPGGPWGPGAAVAGPFPPFAPHPIPESERWATVTHAGNEPFVYQPSNGPVRSVGRVDYEYQIMRTEVTYGEWFEFVEAYGQFISPQFANYVGFTSQSIGLIGNGVYGMNPAAANLGVRIEWRYAARYVNWLHNGKANTPEAFESGVYDTSTFGDIPGVGFTDQQTRSPGATYWIPSEDEWVKSVYFDPHKHGTDQPGYWRYPISQDTMPISGPPGVGQTSAGPNSQPEAFPLPEVAAYREFQSPWGLWDASGGQREWTETAGSRDFAPTLPSERLTRGVAWGAGPYAQFLHEFDRIDPFYTEYAFPSQLIGLRLARAVPGAPGAGVFCCTLTLFLHRRRMSRVDVHSHHPHRVRARVPAVRI